jgi:hypothetical protein
MFSDVLKMKIRPEDKDSSARFLSTQYSKKGIEAMPTK